MLVMTDVYICLNIPSTLTLPRWKTVDGDCRFGYRSHTRYPSSHNPCDHGRLLHIPVDSWRADDSLHYNVRCCIMGDDGRWGSRYQDISHSSFQNYG